MSRRMRILSTIKKDQNPYLNLASFDPKCEIETQTLSIEEDGKLRSKSLLMLINALFAILLMIIQLQVAWDGTRLISTTRSETIKAIISISTLVLVYQIYDFYVFQLLLKQREWEWIPIADKSNITLSTILMNSDLSYKFWAEVLICFIHPIPLIVDDKIGLAMFLRLYLIFRVVHYRNNFYYHENTVARFLKRKERSDGNVRPAFSLKLSLKALYFQNPGFFLTLTTLINIAVAGYGVYIFEREADPQMYTIWVGVYLSFISMATGWPTDSFEDYMPVTFVGRFFCVVSCVVGLFLLTEIVEFVGRQIRKEPHEEFAVNWLTLRKVEEEELHLAATVIQTLYRIRLMNRLRSRVCSPSPSTVSSLLAPPQDQIELGCMGSTKEQGERVPTLTSASSTTSSSHESQPLRRVLYESGEMYSRMVSIIKMFRECRKEKALLLAKGSTDSEKGPDPKSELENVMLKKQVERLSKAQQETNQKLVEMQLSQEILMEKLNVLISRAS
eukprot:TRINITY_DN4681_c0_g1_i2.p1 TRINITY_DN4681_c0_g1~~TRINITY_DN4681_c0_g1_i2.p1  ORF type:complete len:502 (+),score=180.21 TRINITY_DN4681_c0_g1_i2:36-1541(+)